MCIQSFLFLQQGDNINVNPYLLSGSSIPGSDDSSLSGYIIGTPTNMFVSSSPNISSGFDSSNCIVSITGTPSSLNMIGLALNYTTSNITGSILASPSDLLSFGLIHFTYPKHAPSPFLYNPPISIEVNDNGTLYVSAWGNSGFVQPNGTVPGLLDGYDTEPHFHSPHWFGINVNVTRPLWLPPKYVAFYQNAVYSTRINDIAFQYPSSVYWFDFIMTIIYATIPFWILAVLIVCTWPSIICFGKFMVLSKANCSNADCKCCYSMTLYKEKELDEKEGNITSEQSPILSPIKKRTTSNNNPHVPIDIELTHIGENEEETKDDEGNGGLIPATRSSAASNSSSGGINASRSNNVPSASKQRRTSSSVSRQRAESDYSDSHEEARGCIVLCCEFMMKKIRKKRNNEDDISSPSRLLSSVHMGKGHSRSLSRPLKPINEDPIMQPSEISNIDNNTNVQNNNIASNRNGNATNLEEPDADNDDEEEDQEMIHENEMYEKLMAIIKPPTMYHRIVIAIFVVAAMAFLFLATAGASSINVGATNFLADEVVAVDQIYFVDELLLNATTSINAFTQDAMTIQYQQACSQAIQPTDDDIAAVMQAAAMEYQYVNLLQNLLKKSNLLLSTYTPSRVWHVIEAVTYSIVLAFMFIYLAQSLISLVLSCCICTWGEESEACSSLSVWIGRSNQACFASCSFFTMLATSLIFIGTSFITDLCHNPSFMAFPNVTFLYNGYPSVSAVDISNVNYISSWGTNVMNFYSGCSYGNMSANFHIVNSIPVWQSPYVPYLLNATRFHQTAINSQAVQNLLTCSNFTNLQAYRDYVHLAYSTYPTLNAMLSCNITVAKSGWDLQGTFNYYNMESNYSLGQTFTRITNDICVDLSWGLFNSFAGVFLFSTTLAISIFRVRDMAPIQFREYKAENFKNHVIHSRLMNQSAQVDIGDKNMLGDSSPLQSPLRLDQIDKF